ncbi:hypothetical protein FRE64_17180 (plasmid) [Euhalothece natronophila Z-M001]|uniref:Uncharacterized protein n=1 Tax=Euhalothece natronophila Z-M001 TaxID=522448 RepID=A0A5B8NRL6_9CHRO|nr:hypothetical protein [Euhalothece natronophila]QDZ41696.1 hypothetical protein FRE64_17180 [Euhalothece natronophila Z-M001]
MSGLKLLLPLRYVTHETDTNVKVEEESDKQAYHSPRRRGGRVSVVALPKSGFINPCGKYLTPPQFLEA